MKSNGNILQMLKNAPSLLVIVFAVEWKVAHNVIYGHVQYRMCWGNCIIY